MTYLQLGFFRGLSTDNDIPMRFAKFFMGEYTHVCMIFDDENSSYFVSDARYGNIVSYTKVKQFKREGWVMKTICIPQDKISLIRSYCIDAHKRKCTYNYSGQRRSISPFPISGNEETYTCSELVVHAFQNAGLMIDLIPSASTPTDLLTAVDGKDLVIRGTPNKQQLKKKLKVNAGEIRYDKLDETYRTKSFYNQVEDAFDSFV